MRPAGRGDDLVMIDANQFHAFAPQADVSYAPLIDAAAAANQITTPLRLAHWMAQMAIESMYFRAFEENLNYSVSRIVAVWPSRFTLAAAEPLANNPQALANSVYANRMGNGDPASGDGWAFHGRGALQVTGRNQYALIERLTTLPVVETPDLLAEPQNAFTSAGAYWSNVGCNELADADDVTNITRRINGGLTDLSLRVQALNRAKGIWR